MIKLNICSLGEPTDPKTWSGTPFNIYKELQKCDYLASAFNSEVKLNRYKRRVLKYISKIYYLNASDINRGIFHRYANANRIKKLTEQSKSKYTLHTGTLDLPFFKKPKNQKHFLFCDSTWNLWYKYSTNTNKYSKKLLKDAEELEKKSYNQMEHIFPISEYVKLNLIEHYRVNPNKITVVGTGLGVIKPFYGKKNYTNGKILFVAKGRFKDKGGDLVIKAFKIALQNNPNLELTIVGQDEYTNKIKVANIKTYGFIPIEDLQNLFNECSLFLMPAINEPWGLVYLEALACKMPIIGLNRNSFPEISGHGKYGFGLEELNSEKLAQIIIEAFSTPNKLEEIGLRSQEYCLNKFSWSKTVSTIIEKIKVE